MTNRLTCEELRQLVNHVMKICKQDPSLDPIETLKAMFSMYHPLLPPYLSNKYLYVDPEKYKREYFKAENPTFIPINHTYGDTWLFNEKQWWINGRPLPDRLANICMYILNGKELLPIPADKLNDSTYIVSDGNHRIYTAYLMGLSRVPLIVEAQLTPLNNCIVGFASGS